ncbi:MAG: GTP-binding protein [Lachnospiraceae bacterium]|nr:GTP-binding protein [Lachnospiraceae bacterium]
MTRVDLITGFLGSGKTTFIKKYAEYLLEKGENICILENDYGAINVDMMLLSDLEKRGVGLEMVAGGCDYDCHRRRFKTKLITMAMLGYSRVLIEPSGIFDVDEFFDILHEEPLDRLYEIGNVITVVKADLEDDLSDEADFMLASQIANAGCVVLSHVQEVDKSQVKRTVEHLNNALIKVKSSRKLNADSSDVLAKNWNEITPLDYEMIENSGFRHESYEKKIHMDDSGFDALFFMNLDMNLEEIKAAIKNLFNDTSIGRVMRVKGFAKSDDKWYELNATSKGINENEISDGQNVIIVIGENLDKDKIDTSFNARFSTVKTE